MSSRTLTEVERRGEKLWWVRRYWHKPHSDMVRLDSRLAQLYFCEKDFRDGRFLHFQPHECQHGVRVWLDHEEDEKRQWFMRQLLGWVRETNSAWHVETTLTERIGLLFSFDDSVVAYMFMLEFGGEQT